MQNNQEAIREAMRLANSPEGQQLLRILQAGNGADLQKAMASASSGDYAAAKQALSAVLSSPEAQKLLNQMGGSYGPNGR